jgi:hypothetical protein
MLNITRRRRMVTAMAMAGKLGTGCPPGYTVQGGTCAPYRGPVGGGWRSWNGCPPGYTVQGGNCAPYQGPVGGPPRRWYGY